MCYNTTPSLLCPSASHSPPCLPPSFPSPSTATTTFNHFCRLRQHGFTIPNILRTPESELRSLIAMTTHAEKKARYAVSALCYSKSNFFLFIFFSGNNLVFSCYVVKKWYLSSGNQHSYIKRTTEILATRYNNDIPQTVEGRLWNPFFPSLFIPFSSSHPSPCIHVHTHLRRADGTPWCWS